jgi:hypothetical protein
MKKSELKSLIREIIQESWGSMKIPADWAAERRRHLEDQGGYDWAAERRREKEDQGSYARENPEPAYSNRKPATYTLFKVRNGQEDDAMRYGLIKFKSGKWALKHRGNPSSDDEIVKTIETKFGRGEKWTPKK